MSPALRRVARGYVAVVLVGIAVLDVVVGVRMLVGAEPWLVDGPDTVFASLGSLAATSPGIEAAFRRLGAFSLLAGATQLVWVALGWTDRRLWTALLLLQAAIGPAFYWVDSTWFAGTAYLTAKSAIGAAWSLAFLAHFSLYFAPLGRRCALLTTAFRGVTPGHQKRARRWAARTARASDALDPGTGAVVPGLANTRARGGPAGRGEHVTPLYREDGVPAEVWVEPTAEQWFWVRHAGWLFSPSPEEDRGLARWFGIVTVVPSTNVTNTSLQYQAWLNEIFHTTRLARIGHFACMPAIVVLLVAATGPAAPVVAALLGVWWSLWARKEGRLAWAAACALLALAVGALGIAWHAAGMPIAAPLALFALAQAGSHALEPLPPRVTRSSRWVPVPEYVLGRPGERRPPADVVRRAGHLVAQALFGALDEAVASPRLLPVYLLDAMWRCGYDRATATAWRAMAEKAWATGNPALDYIGVGGGTRLAPPVAAALAR